MNALLYGLTLFFVAFFVHLAAWKIHLPKKQTKVLLVVFFGILIIGVLLFLKHGMAISACINLIFMYTALALAYITTYSAVEVDSPSLVMTMKIAKEGKAGLGIDSFNKQISNDVLVIPRLKDLLKAGFAYLENGKYKLTPKGLFMARIFKVYRKLLKREKGG